MKKYLFAAAIISIFNFQFSISHAQRVVTDNWQQLQVEFAPGDLQIGKVSLCGETFSTIAFDGYQPSLDNYGAPALPVFSRLIEVPLDADFEVSVSDAVYDTLPALDYRLVPVQLPRSKSDTTEQKLFILHEVYSQNAFIGQREALVEAVGIARDRRLARLQFSPVRYNPVTGQLIVCRHATVTVTYQGADEQASLALFERYYSPAFNSGAKPLNSLYPKAVRTTAPVRMVIVANSMFRGYLDDFVNWKRRKGFLTDIVYTDNTSVGTTTTSIAAYLKGLYDNATTASPAPTYVLLVGDVAQLPTFDAQITSPSSDHVTDLYYTTWTTGDHLPDCHYGRFSAQNVSQLTPQVQKTLMYEQYTFDDPTFLDRAVMVAGVDAGNAGDNGYTYGDPAMDYAITNYVNGTHGWSQVMYFKNDLSIVPACTTNVTMGSSASSNSALVRSYYNQGAGFINYTAHGGSDGWGTPNFGNTHVNQMTNYRKFGLMIGNCCLTNKFEVSTCFGEALLRKDEYAGAVGYIGGSNSTYWTADFIWAVGVRSSIGPSMSMAYNASNLGVYDRTFHTHNESYANWCTTQGSMVMQGNMAVESSSQSSNYKHYYWEIYHLMGDPSVMPYMTQASTMPLAVQSVITYGTSTLNVSAAPYAYVALTDTVTGTLIAAAYANASGSATLTLPSNLAVNTYLLAASAQQYRTAFQTIRVIQPNGAFPLVTSITSAPLNAGSTVPLTLHVENAGNVTANNITIQLSCNNPSLTLSSSSVTIASLAAGDSTILTAVVNASVAADAADNVPADITATVSWTGSATTAASTLRLWVYAPVLTLSFSPEMPSLMPGATTTVTATLHNSGHAATGASRFSFSSPTSLLSTSASTLLPQPVVPDGDLSVTLTLQADAQLPQGVSIPVSCSFGSFQGSLPVFIGQNFIETFNGGTTHLTGWDAPAAYPWAVSTEQPYEGSHCLRSVQYTSHSMNSDMSFTISVASADTVSFYYRVSSEQGWDKFHFLIDGTSQFNASGEVEWTRAAFPLSAGSHTLTFRYAKDGSVSNGSDCAWIDYLVLPHTSHPVTFLNDTLCTGDNYSLGGNAINTDTPGSGSYSAIAANGAVTLAEYIIYPSFHHEDTVESCGSYSWHGTNYTASGNITDTHTNRYGCDSSYALHLTILPAVYGEETVTACDSYLRNGVEYTESFSETDTLTSALGCDSIATFHLIVNYSVSDTVTVSTYANDYLWNDSLYTQSGSYQQVLQTSEGCDSTVTLVLTFLGGGGTQGIGDIANTLVSAYPNPTTGLLHFSLRVDEVTAFDLTGRIVARQRDTETLDLRDLPQGLYTLRLTLPGDSLTLRILKQ